MPNGEVVTVLFLVAAGIHCYVLVIDDDDGQKSNISGENM
jgi:hypothetical protein